MMTTIKRVERMMGTEKEKEPGLIELMVFGVVFTFAIGIVGLVGLWRKATR